MAHARIRKIGLDEARALPGVKAIFTYADLRPVLTSDAMPLAMPSAYIRFIVDPTVLVIDEACYVGEPIALVIAESRCVAEDAVALIELDLEELPAVSDIRLGLREDSPKARLGCPSNMVAQLDIGYGDIEGAFAQAAVVISDNFHIHKGGGHSIEGRGVVAHFDRFQNLLTVWDSTQMPHRNKAVLVQSLGLRESQVRVIAPNVGGGFGPKAVFYPEELAVPAAALLLGVPLKWIEDRFEHFVSTAQERDQHWEASIAADADGRLLGLRGIVLHDHGAATPYGASIAYNAATNAIGPYQVPAYQFELQHCLTNMVPTAATRGAGRPQGTFVMERLLDGLALRLGLGRDEIRRRNLIPLEKMPYSFPIRMRDGSNMTYDSGNYPECQARALAAADWTTFEQRREAAKQDGTVLGIGIANYVELTGRGPFESASVRIGPSGEISVTTGATNQGQGLKTMLAQLVAEAFNVRPDTIQVQDGDTAASPLGIGAFASRQTVTAGNAVHRAATIVAEKTRLIAAELLEVAPQDLELADGWVRVVGAPDLRRSLGEIAKSVNGSIGFSLPRNATPGLFASVDFEVSPTPFANGTHIAEVEVDCDTGNVILRRFSVVHDCGRMITPKLVEGQVLGGVVHGIGSALFEWMRYDAAGQPQTVTFADYLLPTSNVLPMIEIHHMESPSPLNPLGVKGAAEGGTIAAPAAIVSAIEDALRHLKVRVTDLPVTPPRLRALIHAAQTSA